jgi:hypothetical protein
LIEYISQAYFRITEEILDENHNCVYCGREIRIGDVAKTWGGTGLPAIAGSFYYTFCSEGCRMRWLVIMLMKYNSLQEFAESFKAEIEKVLEKSDE